MTHYESALSLDPGHAQAHNNLGIALTAQGKMDQAAVHHHRALELDPDYVEAHVAMATSSSYQGRFDEAMAEYGRAIAIRPDYAEAHFGRAEIKTFHRGDPDLMALEALAGRGDLTADKAIWYISP